MIKLYQKNLLKNLIFQLLDEIKIENIPKNRTRKVISVVSGGSAPVAHRFKYLDILCNIINFKL